MSIKKTPIFTTITIILFISFCYSPINGIAQNYNACSFYQTLLDTIAERTNQGHLSNGLKMRFYIIDTSKKVDSRFLAFHWRSSIDSALLYQSYNYYKDSCLSSTKVFDNKNAQILDKKRAWEQDLNVYFEYAPNPSAQRDSTLIIPVRIQFADLFYNDQGDVVIAFANVKRHGPNGRTYWCMVFKRRTGVEKNDWEVIDVVSAMGCF